MSILSIHVDESGNFNLSNMQNQRYCLALVFHDQADSISSNLEILDEKLLSMECNVPFIHTTPLIRQDVPFDRFSREKRKSVFRVFARFVEQLPIVYTTFFLSKAFYSGKTQMENALRRQVNIFIEEKLDYFLGFESIVVYYDCGQAVVSRILRETFGTRLGNKVEFRTAYQKDYRLLQVADYICALEQSKLRWDGGCPTNSEQVFFLSRKKFIQNYYKKLAKKRI